MHMTKDMDLPQEKPLDNSADTKKKSGRHYQREPEITGQLEQGPGKVSS